MPSLHARLAATRIGYAGLDGAWWRPAAAPFTLPASARAQLERSGRAIFRLCDLVADLYGTPDGAAGGLDALLEHKVPPGIPRLHRRAPVLALRPDFQLVELPESPQQILTKDQGRMTNVGRQVFGHSPLVKPTTQLPGPVPSSDASYRLVATELEICPSTHGFAHAMQVAYGLEPDLLDGFVELLDGRELIFVSTAQWGEFLIEQLAFCRALAGAGARGRVLLDLPIARFAAEIAAGTRWSPPIFGVRERPAGWRTDLLDRLDQAGLRPFLGPDAWPDQVGDALVFRFGYFDCFSPGRLARLAQWEARGAVFVNPTSFLFDSKAVLAALQLPLIREHLGPEDLAALDGCIPETYLLSEGEGQGDTEIHERNAPPSRLPLSPPPLIPPADWVIKYAGFDRGGGAWGGRSLQVGAQHSAESWAQVIDEACALPWPVVAQRAAPSAKVDITYIDEADQPQVLRGATRLRCFLIRHGAGAALAARVCGAHLTVSAGPGGVSESTDAVQAPVVFR